MVFETERVVVRKAQNTESDIDNFYNLWNNPKVLQLVGFPNGLGISRLEIQKIFAKNAKSEYDSRLVVTEKETGYFIGECKLGSPDIKGISETDVKLLPEFQGQGFGKEIKQGLCHYLFSNTKCQIVQATPNKLNIASQKMQEFCGGKKVGEKIWQAPKDSTILRTDVHAFIYHIHKHDFYKIFDKLNKNKDK